MDPIQSNQFKDFIDILFKRKSVIIIFFVSTVLTAFIGSHFPHEYEAYSKVLFETGRGHVSNRSLPVDGQSRVPTTDWLMERQVDLALQVLNDNTLATMVVEKIGPTVIYEDLLELEQDSPGLREKLYQTLGIPLPEKVSKAPVSKIAAARLQEDIITSRAGTMSSVIYITFRHEDPSVAAEVVNTLVNLYVNRHLELRKKPRLTGFFQEQFDIKKTELATAEDNLREFKQRYNMTSSLEEERTFILTQVVKHQTELDETTSQKAELKNEAKQLRYQLANTAKNPKVLNALHKKLVELQVKEGELSIRYQDDFPTMQSLRAEIQRIREKLEELGYNKRYGTGTLKDEPLYGKLQERLLQTEVELNILKAREATLQSQLTGYNEQMQKLDSVEIEFNSLAEQLSATQNNYRLYETKFEEFRISDALDAEGIANVKVLEPAQAPLDSTFPKTVVIMLLSLFFGGIGGIGLALILELIGGKLSKKEDTERYLERPVLATIPEYDLGAAPQGMPRKAAV